MTILQNVIASVLPARQPGTTLPDFWTVFGSGVTIGSPTFAPAKQVHLPITGTDAVTGYSDSDLDTIYGASTVYEFWGIGDMADAADMDTDPEHLTYFDNTITASNTPLVKGGRQLTNSCKVRVTGAPNPQTHLYIGIQSAAALATPVEAQYFEIDYILPAGLDLQAGDTGTGKFFTIFEVKTGAWYDTGSGTYKQAVGDLRIKLSITGDNGYNQWEVDVGNEANGRGTIPEVGATLTEFFNQTSDETVRLGVPTKVKIYFKLPESLTDFTTSRLKITIKAQGYDEFTLCDETGGSRDYLGTAYPILSGNLGLPLTRLLVVANYTSAELPNPTIAESVQIYDQPSDDLLKALFPPIIRFGGVDISLAGGLTQPREGTDTLSIDFTRGTPTQVTIARNDNSEFAVWPNGALSEHFTSVTGGLEFSLSLAHMNIGVNTVQVISSYLDYQKATDALSLTIEAVTPEPVTKTITVSMLGGLNQTREGRDVFQIDFTSGTPTSLIFARNDEATFAQWPTGNLSAYFTEVTGGLEFDLELTALNLGSNTLAVTATYSDAATATDSLSLVLTEIDAGAVTLGPLPWVPTPLASATMYASPTGNDANPGTFASPKTFQGAITAATPGSVIFLRGGTYPVTDSAHIQAWAEGTAGAPIIFESYPDELAIIDGSGMTPWVGNKRINVSGQYQKFRGLRITGFPENGFLVGTGSHHTTIDGCEIDNCHLSGIMNFNSSDNRYINCYVHDCSDVGGAANGGNADGISVASGSRNYVGNCLVENCSDDGIDSWQSQDTVFEFNIVRGCGLGDGNGNGFKCGGADIGANAMVNNNLAYNNRALGFDVNTGINVTFKNNTSYNNDAQGYGLESDTIAINNVSSGDGSIKYGTGIPTNNSWNIGGTLTFISTTEGNANFLKVTQGGAFDGIGWEYI